MKGKVKYFAPAGYFPNGEARPWREVRLLMVQDDGARVQYLDTGEVTSCYLRHLKKEIIK